MGTFEAFSTSHSLIFPWSGNGEALKLEQQLGKLSDASSSKWLLYLVVEPTPLKNMLVKMGIFPK